LKTILLITSELPPQPGGIGTHAHLLAKHLAVTEHVQVIADQRSGSGEEEHVFDQGVKYSIQRVRRYPWIVVTYLLRLFASLTAAKHADVILVSGKFSLWQVHLLKLFYTKPIITVIHGSEILIGNTYLRRLTHRALEKCKHVIAVSAYTLGLVKHLDLNASSVIPNAIELSSDLQSPKKIKDHTAPQLLTVGNLTQRKGQHNLIQALPLLLKRYPNLQYHCVGIPTDINRLQRLAEDLEVAKHVTFHGRLTDDEKNKLYQESDLFVMLSEQTASGDVEGFGIAILEANAYGLPAIGSFNSGIEDAIKPNYSGLLVNPHAKEAIVQAITKMLSQHHLFQQNALDWVQAFQWNTVIKDYLSIIHQQ
jgi:glycosyltransferase involved in cell wall biosynthesis